MTRHRASLLWVGLLLSGCSAHQAAMAERPKDPGAGSVNGSPLERPSTEPGRFGSVRFPVTCSRGAQEQFDLAVAQLHSFFYPETVKSFTRVLEIDPGCAMAYWGIARSLPPNPLVPPFPPGTYQRGREAVAKGKALSPPTQRERDWLDAMSAYFDDPDDVPQAVRARRYAGAMERLAARYPDDAEAQIFHALALLESADPHDRSFEDQFKAARILEAQQPTHPAHPGITHYLIHAYDYAPIASKGLDAANEYARIAPGAPHALHMPSHVYSMLGMWNDSIRSNRVALASCRDYATHNLPAGVTYTGEVHSLDFLTYAYLQLGQDANARRVVEEARAVKKLSTPMIAGDAALAVIPARYALEHGDWAAAAALPPWPSAYPYAEAVRLFARAAGAARAGGSDRILAAKADLERMRELRARYAGKEEQEYWAEQVEILVDAAAGWLEHAQGNDAEALRLLGRAADLEDASEKHVAMENRVLATREQLADLLLEMRRPREALAAYETSLQSTPNRRRGYAGAVKAAELSGEPGKARFYADRLRDLTADGDAPAPDHTGASARLATDP